MIVPDINLLLYAYLPEYAQHVAAKAWWEQTLDNHEAVGIPSIVAFGFVRISTNRRAVTRPASIDEALAAIDSWYAHTHVQQLIEGPRYRSIVFDLLRALGTGGNLTPDAQIAAFAIEHGATLCSNDADFARMPGLAWRNPLAP